MENLRRHFTKEKDNVIGRVKQNGRCKKHPKHRQSPGVCSLCLREKLTQLSSSNNPRRRTSSIIIANSSSSSSSLSSSYYSSSSSGSSCASPIHCFCFTNEGKSSSSVSIFLLSDNHGIVKSRSLAIVPRRDCERGVHHHGHDKSANKSGFWFKLLHPKSKRMEDDHKDSNPVRSMSIKI
ncbi:uncharacterized protein LOC113848396 [Abrus precatorius]|uniref:Uncharacterized protein LOC113848396 n=1 Tax=Abrus precatorius TaxID=3816 RepID=A0A8B8JSZ8_ABRPR|nr:uncharacterized protein LOC113848396 [Abrus precatorius]